MQLGKLFEKNYLVGKLGLYPFTPENLMRVGLALCVYLKIHKDLGKPLMVIEDLNFLTLSLGVGFMAGGGDISLGFLEGDIKVRSEHEGDRTRLIIENLQEYELKMVESILFSRYNMPRAEGEEVGRIWIQEKRH
jgi:hypothetical protein|uniref:Uncharacterized protein n=1 Tax=Hydrogenobacter sp. TaxID=2152829 RepID=A0A7C2V3J5_9AQUI